MLHFHSHYLSDSQFLETEISQLLEHTVDVGLLVISFTVLDLCLLLRRTIFCLMPLLQTLEAHSLFLFRFWTYNCDMSRLITIETLDLRLSIDISLVCL